MHIFFSLRSIKYLSTFRLDAIMTAGTNTADWALKQQLADHQQGGEAGIQCALYNAVHLSRLRCFADFFYFLTPHCALNPDWLRGFTVV